MIVAEAYRLGLTTAAHAHAVPVIADVVAAGFDTIEHFTFLTAEGVGLRQDLLDEVVRRGTFVGFPLGTTPGAAPALPAMAARSTALMDLVAKVIASGARIVPGSDAGIEPTRPHDVFPHTLTRLAELGMPTREVLRSATSVAAEAVGLGGRKGVLRPGADADLLVLVSSPVDDMSAVMDVRAVYRAGHWVRRPGICAQRW